MSEWSRAAAENFKNNREAFQKQSEMILFQDRKKHEGGLDLWAEVKSHLAAKCKEFNDEMHGEEVLRYESSQSLSAKVTGDFLPRKSSITVTYDKEKCFVEYGMDNSNAGKPRFTVGVSGGDAVLLEGNKSQASPDVVASIIINSLLAMQKPK